MTDPVKQIDVPTTFDVFTPTATRFAHQLGATGNLSKTNATSGEEFNTLVEKFAALNLIKESEGDLLNNQKFSLLFEDDSRLEMTRKEGSTAIITVSRMICHAKIFEFEAKDKSIEKAMRHMNPRIAYLSAHGASKLILFKDYSIIIIKEDKVLRAYANKDNINALLDAILD